MEITKMSFDDFDKIKEKLQNDFDEFWNENILKKELENPNNKYIVAKENEEILGFAGLELTPVDCQISNIVVKKNFRNRKIGSKLLEELIKIARETKLDFLRLEVNENNIYAIKLYEKYNFEKVGLRKKYYNGKENAILMDLKLI